ncbi:glycosyl transferase family 2 [Gammaproteobacteria bacterium 42_54_T18]|nr:glycosyl transferase family 2 [Gammaproteobacteria bacterium 42_54_T18]
MKIFVSVVSHGHEKLISELGCLAELSQHIQIEIVIKNNISINNLSLKTSSIANNIHLLDECYGLGFGENNNYVYQWCVDNLNMTDDDWFLVLNPDVLVESSSLLELVKRASENGSELATINLYKDNEFKAYDNCVRNFPTLVDFISSYIGLGNKTIIDKKNVHEEQNVDWAAGSFLLFKARLYHELGGFDPKYFMYCEDIDICWRAQKLKAIKMIFYPDIKAIHFAEHANRSLFSKHFIWHIKSIIRYLLVSYSILKPFNRDQF